MSVGDLYKNCNFLSVNQSVAEATLLELFSILRNKQPLLLYEAFDNESSKISTRSGGRLICKVRNATVSTFFGRAVHLWNLLPCDIKQCEQRAAFKRKIRPWIKDNITLRII